MYGCSDLFYMQNWISVSMVTFVQTHPTCCEFVRSCLGGFFLLVWKLIKIYCMHNIYLTHSMRTMQREQHQMMPFLHFSRQQQKIKYRISFCQTTHKMNEWMNGYCILKCMKFNTCASIWMLSLSLAMWRNSIEKLTDTSHCEMHSTKIV